MLDYLLHAALLQNNLLLAFRIYTMQEKAELTSSQIEHIIAKLSSEVEELCLK